MPKVMNRDVGPIGYGLLGLTTRPQPLPREVSIGAMRAALMKGCNFWNGGEFYSGERWGNPGDTSLTLLRDYFEKYPEDVDKVVLNIKGCADTKTMTPVCSRADVRKSVENCLAQLGGKGKIDMFEPGRRDPKVPLEETINALKELQDEGKIGGVALSEVNANTIREASKIVKIVCLETEISLFSTDAIHNGITAACKELDIPICAYGTVAKGFLSGQIKSMNDIPEQDFRRMLPRFHPENFDANLQLADEIGKIAKNKGCTPAQLSIAWVAALSDRPDMPTIIPIPGASAAERVEENAGAADVKLTEQELEAIQKVLDTCEVKGTRYHAHGMTMVDG